MRLRFAALVGLLACSALAADKFKPAGAMANARTNHTATVLKDGRVLVTGGQGSDALKELDSCELWDPRTGRWSPTGSLLRGRAGHTATLLADGHVLVVGGTVHESTEEANRFVALPSAELYDPKTGKWSQTGQMVQARHGHTATLLPNGKVLIAGGARELKSHLASCELYDPASGTFKETTPMGEARFLHRAILLLDGRVLVVGGRSNQSGGGGFGNAVASSETYSVDSGTWSKAPDMSEARQAPGAVLLSDGRAMVVGGATDDGATNYVELWGATEDPPAKAWRRAEHSLSVSLLGHSTTLLPDGRVLVVGGEPGNAVDTARAQLFEPGQERWCLSASLSSPRKFHTASLLKDGRVLVVGGVSAGVPEDSAEVWSSGGKGGKCVEPPGVAPEPEQP